MANTTRENLIEVARQLFDRKGLENTTMSDIASASDRGRRTIYTYFKNKVDIYNAVLERESENLIAQVRSAVEAAGNSPEAQLKAFIGARIRLIAHETVQHKDTSVYKAFFLGEMRRWERVRRLVHQKEISLLLEILQRGTESGIFSTDTTAKIGGILQILFQGIEVKWLHECNCLNDNDVEKLSDDINSLILLSLRP